MNQFMVLIPAYNEEGAVASVVEEVRAVVPDATILVVDDCSEDNTIGEARRSGASVLPLPHHLGLGGCVQAGYRLAFELDFEYVIRVDGDGQHDPVGEAPPDGRQRDPPKYSPARGPEAADLLVAHEAHFLAGRYFTHRDRRR